MSRFRVIFSPKAREQLDRIDAWWEEHRPENPALVETEMAEAIGALAVFPEVGEAHGSRRLRGVRKVLLPRSQYFVYYRAYIDQKLIEIVAVWHASRGRPPRL